MFEMKEVGRKIAGKRREKDLTQMELADLMGVSFQAVSNWERGNSMPDIAKLPDLSSLLDISIDELLTDKPSASLVRHILDGDEEDYIRDEEVRTETVAEVAPLLKPRQTERLISAVLDSGDEKPRFKDLSAVAPHVSEDFLGSLVLRLAGTATVKDIASLAPFLSKETLDQLVDLLTEQDVEMKEIVRLAPYLSRETLDKLALKAAGETGVKDLTRLAPFLPQETLGHVAENLAQGGLEMRQLMSLAPFLPKETLDTLAMNALKGATPEDVVKLAPFLPKETLHRCANALLETPDIKLMKRLAPFL